MFASNVEFVLPDGGTVVQFAMRRAGTEFLSGHSVRARHAPLGCICDRLPYRCRATMGSIGVEATIGTSTAPAAAARRTRRRFECHLNKKQKLGKALEAIVSNGR